jgi:hypothetical protein
MKKRKARTRFRNLIKIAGEFNNLNQYKMEDKKTEKRDTSNNIVTADADIPDINKGRREKPAGDMVDERLPENNRNHQWKQKDSEFMQQDEILNQERAASDNPGKNGRNAEGEFSDNSKQEPTVPDDFYDNQEKESTETKELKQ